MYGHRGHDNPLVTKWQREDTSTTYVNEKQRRQIYDYMQKTNIIHGDSFGKLFLGLFLSNQYFPYVAEQPKSLGKPAQNYDHSTVDGTKFNAISKTALSA